jgi:hypothetical protein
MPPREAKLIDKAKQAIQEANDNGKQGLNYPINYEPRGVQQVKKQIFEKDDVVICWLKGGFYGDKFSSDPNG